MVGLIESDPDIIGVKSICVHSFGPKSRIVDLLVFIPAWWVGHISYVGDGKGEGLVELLTARLMLKVDLAVAVERVERRWVFVWSWANLGKD